MASSLPLISCICITRDKPALLLRSIQGFESQTYPNKELLIIYEDQDLLTMEFFNTYQKPSHSEIILINSVPKKTLGELRNLAISQANGEFICQWDDDDWCHNERLQRQYDAIKNSSYSACVLKRWLLFNNTSNRAYLSSAHFWEGSILCRKDVFEKVKYSDLKMEEEKPVLSYLVKNKLVYAIEDMPHLYIYIYHGNNTWNNQHWRRAFMLGKQLGPEISNKIAELLNACHSTDVISQELDKLVAQTLPKAIIEKSRWGS